MSFRIGEYSLTKWDDGTIWISKDDGEGMQITEELLEVLIDEFWKEHF